MIRINIIVYLSVVFMLADSSPVLAQLEFYEKGQSGLFGSLNYATSNRVDAIGFTGGAVKNGFASFTLAYTRSESNVSLPPFHAVSPSVSILFYDSDSPVKGILTASYSYAWQSFRTVTTTIGTWQAGGNVFGRTPLSSSVWLVPSLEFRGNRAVAKQRSDKVGDTFFTIGLVAGILIQTSDREYWFITPGIARSGSGRNETVIFFNLGLGFR